MLYKVLLVRPLCVNLHTNCGFCGKSTNIFTNELKDILKEFRYYAKLDFCRESHKKQKSKMAAIRNEISVNVHVFVNSGHKNISEESFCMFSDIKNPMEPLLS